MDFFFFPTSTYTYLTALRIEEAAARSGISLRWRPFNVRAIMIEMDNIPFARKPIKARYMWRDIERRAATHGLPWAGQPPYPADPELKALKVATLAAREGWGADFIKASYRAWFLDGKAPGVGGHTEEIVTQLGRDAGTTIRQALGAENEAAVAGELDEARDLGIFGSPTFVVGKEIFWGDDRLEDALAWARRA